MFQVRDKICLSIFRCMFERHFIWKCVDVLINFVSLKQTRSYLGADYMESTVVSVTLSYVNLQKTNH